MEIPGRYPILHLIPGISKLAETLLSFFEVVNNIKIESSLHGREKMVAGYRVDGFYEIREGEILNMWPTLQPGTKIVFEVISN